MTLTTIIEACPLWLYKFALRNNTEFENNYQDINQTISYKGCGSEKQEQTFRACPGKPNTVAAGKCPPPGSSTCAALCVGKKPCGPKNMVTQARFLDILQNVRQPIAEYQENHGLARNEQYGFVNLITSLSQHAYQAILTILTMLYNLLPLFEGFSYLARFILDKLIDICQTDDRTEKVIKISMFVGELIIIILILMIICGFILLPVWYLFSHMLGKIWNMLMSSS